MQGKTPGVGMRGAGLFVRVIFCDVDRHVLQDMADVMVGNFIEDLLGMPLALDEPRAAQQAQVVADKGKG